MQSSRIYHINESRNLLWELGTCEPTVLQCFQIIESFCLSNGIHCRIDGELCSKEFEIFLNEEYVEFVRNCLRYFIIYGFVPFYIKTHENGQNQIPEILPHGTFLWTSEVTTDKKNQQIGNSLVHYRVEITAALKISNDDVHIFACETAHLDINQKSILYASVISPMSHVLVDYKNLRQAQIRRARADAWNTSAKIICKYKPTYRVQEDPSSSLMDFADEDYFQSSNGLFPRLAATNLWTRDVQIRQQFERPAEHIPEVYTLPRDHETEQQQMLQSHEDMNFLLSKFQKDVANVCGIPYDYVFSNSSSHETVKKTLTSGRIFSSNMTKMCKNVCLLLKHVYEIIYNKKNAEFSMIPLPKLEIESVQDLKILFDIGSITPDISMDLSNILLGDDVENQKDIKKIEKSKRLLDSAEEKLPTKKNKGETLLNNANPKNRNSDTTQEKR